jgi:hypothetical protein
MKIKRFISIITIISVFLIATVPVFADTSLSSDALAEEVTDISYLSDGSRIVTTIAVDPPVFSPLATTSTKTGYKKVSYENSSGTLLWYVRVSAARRSTKNRPLCVEALCLSPDNSQISL